MACQTVSNTQAQLYLSNNKNLATLSKYAWTYQNVKHLSHLFLTLMQTVN